jgi:hypothetical protein
VNALSLKATVPANGTVDLSKWANIKPNEDWTFGENNNLGELAATIPQPEGFAFGFGDFIQLAGKGFRFSRSHMLPRIAGWIPFNGTGFARLVPSCRFLRRWG